MQAGGQVYIYYIIDFYLREPINYRLLFSLKFRTRFKVSCNLKDFTRFKPLEG